MSLYDLLLGGLKKKPSQSLNHTLGKLITGYVDPYEQIDAGYYDGSMVNYDAIYCAARKGRLHIVKYLVSCSDAKNDANILNDAMCEAAAFGHLHIVKYLVSCGANNWNRCMHHAAAEGHFNIVIYLDNCGANDWNGSMYYAMRDGYLHLVDYFKQKIQDEKNLLG